MDDTTRGISEIFSKLHFHHVLVVDDKKPQGVISDRDVLKVSSPFIGTYSEQVRDTSELNKRRIKL